MANQTNTLAKSEARYVRVSAQKARLVVDMIRGQQAGDAITILRGVNKRIAPSVEKVLRSQSEACAGVLKAAGKGSNWSSATVGSAALSSSGIRSVGKLTLPTA